MVIRFAIALFALLLAGSTGAQTSDLGAAYPGFDTRYAVFPGADLSSLIEAPALISMAVEIFKDPDTGERRLKGLGEAQGVYDIAFKDLLASLEDPAGALASSPRLLQSRNEETKGPRMVLSLDVGIVFLGVKVGYRFRSEQYRDDLSPTEVGYRLRLVESLDGNLFEAYTSLYAREVMVGGRRLVYLRILSRPGLRRPALGMDMLIRSFTPGELKSTLDRTVKAARRRSASLDSAMPHR